jgi:hypothetical protein
MKKKTQMTNVRNGRGDISTDSTDIKIIRNNHEQCYANELNNLDEWTNTSKDKNHHCLLQKKKENLTNPVSIKVIELALKNLPIEKIQCSDGFPSGSTKRKKHQFYTILLENRKREIVPVTHSRRPALL